MANPNEVSGFNPHRTHQGGNIMNKINELKAILPQSMRKNVDWHISEGREPIKHMLNFYTNQKIEYQATIDKMIKTGQRPNDSVGTFGELMKEYSAKHRTYTELARKIQDLINIPEREDADDIILKFDTVVDRLVDFAVECTIFDSREILENGWVGYRDMSCEGLIALYNETVGDERNECLIHIVKDQPWENQDELTDDDVLLLSSRLSVDGDWYEIGTKCTVMEIDQSDDMDTYYNILQEDADGVEIKCTEMEYMKCSDVE